MLPRKSCRLSHFIQITEHFVYATLAQHFLMSRHFLPHVEISEPTSSTNNTNNTNNKHRLWLLSRIVLISQFIAIYKNMKNADRLQKSWSGQQGHEAANWKATQIIFKCIFFCCFSPICIVASSVVSNEANGIVTGNTSNIILKPIWLYL